MLNVAAPNSSDRSKAKADIVFKGPLVCDELQDAADQAWDERDTLVLSPGKYRIAKTIETHCSIRCEGYVWITWRGADDGSWMIRHTGVSGRIDPQDIVNLRLHGNKKAAGLRVDDVHRSTIEGFYCWHTKGGGLKATKGWHLFIRNYSCNYGETPALELAGFSVSVLDGFGAIHLKGDAPVLKVWGVADLRQVGIEDCDTGESCTVVLSKFNYARLSGLYTERLQAPSILRVKDSIGAKIERLSIWQEPKAPIPIVALVTKSKDVTIDRVRAWNVSDAIVRFDADSTEDDCKATRVREMIRQNLNVQPRHLIDYAGRGDR